MPKASIIPLDQVSKKGKFDWSVTLHNVSIQLRSKQIINEISCRLLATGISVIMGENGAGKSMLLKTIAGLIRPSRGYIQHHPTIAGQTAMVFQTPVLLRRSARGNLDHALKIARFARRHRRQKIVSLLDTCSLTAFADRPARNLSGGEQQRLQMARALALEPKLLLMDEPTANLDPRSIMAIEELIEVTSRSGVKIVLVTHNLGQAKRLAGEVFFLSQGRLVESGDANQLFSAPRTEAFQAYIDGRLYA